MRKYFNNCLNNYSDCLKCTSELFSHRELGNLGVFVHFNIPSAQI